MESKYVCLIEQDIQNASDIISWNSIDDAKAFRDSLLKQVNRIKIDSQEFYKDIKVELCHYMWKNLKKILLGCTALCPFCKEMCDGKSFCGTSKKHFVQLHRPQCLAKLLKNSTRNIVVDICTTSIGSNYRFRNKDTKWNWRFYAQYQSLYPNWFISNTAKPVEPYWKWVVTRFGEDIAKWSGYGKTKSIPQEWYNTTEKDAEECLNLISM